MPAKTPKTLEERAMQINNTPKATAKRRAVIYFERVQFDLGLHGSAESFHTLLALRKHLAEGNPPPQMKQFRQAVMDEVNPEAAAERRDYEEIEALLTDARQDLTTLEVKLSEAERSLESVIEQRDELQRQVAEMETELEKRGEAIRVLSTSKPWATRAVAAAAAAIAIVAIWFNATSEFLIAGEPISAGEIASIEGVRTGDLEVVKTGVPPTLDGLVMDEDEVARIRMSRNREAKVKDDEVTLLEDRKEVTELIKKGVNGWLEERLSESSP